MDVLPAARLETQQPAGVRLSHSVECTPWDGQVCTEELAAGTDNVEAYIEEWKEALER
jgi:hypothetical protein